MNVTIRTEVADILLKTIDVVLFFIEFKLRSAMILFDAD